MTFLNTKAGMVAVGVIAAGVVVYFFARRTSSAAGDAAGAVGRAVNPTHPDNIFSRAVDQIGDVFDNASDDNSFSLGAWLHGLINPEFENYDPNAPTTMDRGRVSGSKKPTMTEDDRLKFLSREPIA